jgi:Icc-related predicted phosphoesterase
VFSDYRVQDIELLIEHIGKIEPQPDLILYAGDDINRFRPSRDRNLFEELASKARCGVCAVAGNDDRPSVTRRIRGRAVFNVHLAPVTLGDYAILGLEGAPATHVRSIRHAHAFGRGAAETIVQLKEPGIGYLLYSEREASKHLNGQSRLAKSKKLIIVSHTPPHGVLDRAIRFSEDGRERPIGSRALRDFVQKKKNAVLVVCGHVHRCGGMHRAFGRTLVVNAASHDDEGALGRLAIIDLPPGLKPKVEWQEVWHVPGVGPATAERLRAVGVRSLENLADAPLALLAQVPNLGVRPEIVKSRAQAMLERQAMLTPAYQPHNWPSIWSSIFLDIETDLNQSYVWLIGLIAGVDGEYVSLFAETPTAECKILEQFLNFTQRFPSARILTCSGSHFEQRVLRNRLSQHGLDASICDRIEDLSFWIQCGVALPSGYTVKEIGNSFGYSYKHPELAGREVANLYDTRYLPLKKRQEKEQLARRLLEYNEDDVRCLPFILRAIEKLEVQGCFKAPVAGMRPLSGS